MYIKLAMNGIKTMTTYWLLLMFTPDSDSGTSFSLYKDGERTKNERESKWLSQGGGRR